MGKLTVGGPLQIEREPKVQTKEPNWNGFPEEYIGMRIKYRNCGPQGQSREYTHAERTKVGSKVVKTKVIKLGMELYTEVSYEYAKTVGAKTSVKFSGAIETSKQEEKSNEEEQTFTAKDVINIAPMHLTTWQHEFIELRVNVPFEGDVQVDAPVATNQEGISLASQVIPSAADRTFQIAGYVANGALFEGSTDLQAVPLTEEQCREPAPSQPEAYAYRRR
ncbi:hypothetical protein IVB03_14030 [Bradyrhizobium sp. 168]|uniref:hypothetical protein n=1 Tax=Bradyrhizobium sp. 168 TaxID=2782639 RepID=UPI001FFACC57|nr:hypothetical protein [Bradyrhizobium sp. 168]MCK1580670.1 hypothetical protein [Bradyrhizobium sp. 168]